MGRQPYKLLVSTRTLAEKFGEKLLAALERFEVVYHYVECLGAWDFELNVETSSPVQLSEICDHVLASFPDEVIEVQALSILKVHKRRAIPSWS